MMKNFFSNLDKAQVIALLLVVALIFNAIIHWTHPAYRYYRDKISLMDSRYDARYKEFVSDVRTNLVPSIAFVATNNINSLVAFSRSFQNSSQFQDRVSSSSSSSKTLNRSKLNANYWSIGGDYGLWFEGYSYRVGDSFRGENILAIDPSCMLCDNTLYIIGRSSSNSNVAGNSLAKNDLGDNDNEQL